LITSQRGEPAVGRWVALDIEALQFAGAYPVKQTVL
jgi:hypothetical protein